MAILNMLLVAVPMWNDNLRTLFVIVRTISEKRTIQNCKSCQISRVYSHFALTLSTFPEMYIYKAYHIYLLLFYAYIMNSTLNNATNIPFFVYQYMYIRIQTACIDISVKRLRKLANVRHYLLHRMVHTLPVCTESFMPSPRQEARKVSLNIQLII